MVDETALQKISELYLYGNISSGNMLFSIVVFKDILERQ